jgi:hypothetical protein
MGIDHKKIHAAASASFCVRSITGSLLVCCGLLGASLVHADSGGDRDRDAQQHRDDGRNGHPQNAPQPRQADPRQADPRQAEQPRQLDPRSYEARAEEQRRAMQEAGRNAEMTRRVGRLTPDERRDLRRQINEVGQDIYANPPRR